MRKPTRHLVWAHWCSARTIFNGQVSPDRSSNGSVGLLDYSGKVTLTLGNSVTFNVARIAASKEGILDIGFQGPTYAPGDPHAPAAHH